MAVDSLAILERVEYVAPRIAGLDDLGLWWLSSIWLVLDAQQRFPQLLYLSAQRLDSLGNCRRYCLGQLASSTWRASSSRS